MLTNPRDAFRGQSRSPNIIFIIIIIIIIMSYGHGPLRPNIKLLQTSWSCAIFTTSPILRPVHSVMLSNHRFGCLPRHCTPSIEPNSTLFSSRLSGMRQICPNSVSFLCLMVLMMQISVTPHFFFHLLFNWPCISSI